MAKEESGSSTFQKESGSIPVSPILRAEVSSVGGQDPEPQIALDVCAGSVW